MNLLEVYKEKRKQGKSAVEALFEMREEGNLTDEVLDEYMLEHLDEWKPKKLPNSPGCYEEHRNKYKEAVEKAKEKKKQSPSKKDFFCEKCMHYLQTYFDILQENWVKMKDLENLKKRLLERNPGDERIGKIDIILYNHRYAESEEYERLRAGRKK